MYVNEPECEAAGLDPKAVAKVARKVEAAGKAASELGLTIFGGSGNGSLRCRESQDNDVRALIVAEIMGGCFDGGAGGESPDAAGLIRGE